MVDKGDRFEISVYRGELTMQCLAENQIKLLKVFPSLTPSFHEILTERLKLNNYCDKRLNDAVGHVIDNCIYPTPTIAQFISFDKKIKVYDYSQKLKLINEIGEKANKLYKMVRLIDNQPNPMYAHINDIQEYNLELWEK